MKSKSIIICGLFAAVLTVTSWISVPFAVPFTMQTFGIFCALLVLGGRLGTAVVSVYILLGAFGLPVFAGFQGGIGIIVSPLGGFILGFLLIGIVYLVVTSVWGEGTCIKIIGISAGLAACYIAGTIWYMMFIDGMDFSSAFAVCVIPFIIPDIVKILLAVYVSNRIKSRVRP
ncbi:MAG: biotin transporter BioY [Oscillospiraceae bacterium]|nr:biotin transporter BioY [Oscillospiraceae bacterium]